MYFILFWCTVLPLRISTEWFLLSHHAISLYMDHHFLTMASHELTLYASSLHWSHYRITQPHTICIISSLFSLWHHTISHYMHHLFIDLTIASHNLTLYASSLHCSRYCFTRPHTICIISSLSSLLPHTTSRYMDHLFIVLVVASHDLTLYGSSFHYSRYCLTRPHSIWIIFSLFSLLPHTTSRYMDHIFIVLVIASHDLTLYASPLHYSRHLSVPWWPVQGPIGFLLFWFKKQDGL